MKKPTFLEMSPSSGNSSTVLVVWRCVALCHLLDLLDPPCVSAGSAWLVTFPEGYDHELFEVDTAGMGGTSPFSLVEEVGSL